ncbi:hypothetical protein EXIGLDRAFT_218859 [Exidia glandulosa HHB12029]|uniref:Uncharacterized protein n=1 Tax=Exidia glandulosa HHB12029 TaxID=1314781 RepID=A0A165EDP9_EXIGL|nr:hypothetical protein EXIGLDRAFT_218859 [Exidia glandulosa HHB12029]
MSHQHNRRDTHGSGNNGQGGQAPPVIMYDNRGNLLPEFQQQIVQQIGYGPSGYEYQGHQQQPSQGAGYPYPASGSHAQQGQMHPQIGGQGYGGVAGRGYAPPPRAATHPYGNHPAAQTQYALSAGQTPALAAPIGAGSGQGPGHYGAPVAYSDNDIRIMRDTQMNTPQSAPSRTRRSDVMSIAEGHANESLELQREQERANTQNPRFRDPSRQPNFDPRYFVEVINPETGRRVVVHRTHPLARQQAGDVSPSVCTFNKSSKMGGPSRFRESNCLHPRCQVISSSYLRL